VPREMLTMAIAAAAIPGADLAARGSPRHHVARRYGAPTGTDPVRVG
jgi:hypothetical protein